MSDLLQHVLSTLGPDDVAAMARRIGASPQQTERAIEAALPLLIGQMSRNVREPQGAQALQHALERDHLGVDPGGLLGAVLGGSQGGNVLGNVLGSVFGGGQTSAARGRDPISDGLAILGHVFGQKQQRVTNGVGQVGGIDSQQSSQLLAMLAPIVMAVLGRMFANRGGGTQALGGILGGGDPRATRSQGNNGGLLGAVLDRDGDGDVDLGDLLQNGQLLGGLFGRR